MLNNKTTNADILQCIANLSNSEVFTPPPLVNKILDNLPLEVWNDPNLKWLEPSPKTGVFLREIAKRLMVGLELHFPNPKERIDHILTNMIYGLPISQITALMSRRTLYTAKDPSKIDHSKSRRIQTLVKMDTSQGNLPFENMSHTYKNGNCIYCGIKKGVLDGDGRIERESYAYPFIHIPWITPKLAVLNSTTPKLAVSPLNRGIGSDEIPLSRGQANGLGVASIYNTIQNMKFDIIIGNPPYQISDGGHGASAMPIYQKFVEMAISLKPKYVSFIIPSRWFAGGKGLDEFRANMLKDKRISHLTDYPNANDCFPGVEIKGGVCHFLWDKKHKGECIVRTMRGEEIVSEMIRPLDGYDVFIKHNEALTILEKVQKLAENTLEEKVSSRKPFGFATNFEDFETTEFAGSVKIWARGRQGFVAKNKIVKGLEWVNKYKVLTARAAEGGGDFPNWITGKPIVVGLNTCCTETYLVVDVYDTLQEAQNMDSYLRTRFVRFLISLKKNTQDLNQSKFSFVPDLGMNTLWTDEALYQKYALTTEEIAFIESIVREM